MYQQERLDKIIEILKSIHYTTVDYLVEQIRYSPASIRRDLALLEKQGLVKRSYGGVEILEENLTPFKFRQHSMKSEKNKIAEAAAALVKNGDTIFLDASTTTQYMGHYLTEKKNITVVTNNIMLASYLKEHGVEVYCTGGLLTELPGSLTGIITANTFSMFRADIMFFSEDGIDSDGLITVAPEEHYIYKKVMLDNSDKSVFLCSSDKIGRHSKFIQCSLNEIDYFISNTKLDEKIIKKYPNTEFICTKKDLH